MASTIFRGHFYTANRLSNATISVSARFAFKSHEALFTETDDARRWLGDHGLPRGKAKRLLADLIAISGDKLPENAN